MEKFETASFHIVKPCNFACKFCYATFDDLKVGSQMTLSDAETIIDKLVENGVQKITFAGGEPMLYKHLDDIIIYAKMKRATTSIITNGYLITDDWLRKMKPVLDWIGISVDSIDDETNKKIGRKMSSRDYIEKLVMINSFGYKLKLNTVVNAYNKNEDFHYLIDRFAPERWKVFQALRVSGQNDRQFDEIKVSDIDYKFFVARHRDIESIVPEDNELMTGSYLLIDPLGRMFENSKGEHTYSDSLIENSYDHCINQISLNHKTFLARGGIYEWN